MIPRNDYSATTSDGKYVVVYRNIGEFRMGCDGYGFVLTDENRNVVVDAFKDKLFNVNVPRPNMTHFQYDDKTGLFLMSGNYMREVVFIDARRKSICPYQLSTATFGEYVIYGMHTDHLYFLGTHYYLQAPWIANDKYNSVMRRYYEIRERQVAELRQALPNQAL